eukprot:3307380-Pyramimonas_sp.AAC.1
MHRRSEDAWPATSTVPRQQIKEGPIQEGLDASRRAQPESLKSRPSALRAHSSSQRPLQPAQQSTHAPTLPALCAPPPRRAH